MARRRMGLKRGLYMVRGRLVEMFGDMKWEERGEMTVGGDKGLGFEDVYSAKVGQGAE